MSGKPKSDDDFVVDFEIDEADDGGDDVEFVDLTGRRDEDAPPPPAATALPDEPDDEDELAIERDEDGNILWGDDDDASDNAGPARKEDDGDDDLVEVEVDESDAPGLSAEAQAQINQANANAAWVAAQAEAQTAHSALQQVEYGLKQVERERAQIAERIKIAEGNEDAIALMRLEQARQSLDAVEAELNQHASNIPDPQQIIQKGQQAYQAELRRQPPGRTVGAGVTSNNPLATRWASANSQWMRGDAQAARMVSTISGQMTQGGWDPDEPGFYAELAKRVKTQRPDLQVRTFNSTKAAKGERGGQRRPATPAARSRSAQPSASNRAASAGRGGTYTLTKHDFAVMRKMGLDPGDKEQRQEFAKTRMDDARQARLNG